MASQTIIEQPLFPSRVQGYEELSTAAGEFLRVAGGLEPALSLVTDLVRMLTKASDVSMRLVLKGAAVAEGELEPARSAVSAPVYEQQEIIGHLEMVSPELGAFDEADMRGLRRLADLVAEMVQQDANQGKKAPVPLRPQEKRIRGRLDEVLRWPAIRMPAMPRIKLHLR